MRKCLILILLIAISGLSQNVVAAESVQDGVADLAQAIVGKSKANNSQTLAVAAFPMANDTCSQLSNYLADELVLSLFSVPDSDVRIIERSQLHTILGEIAMDMSGIVDANTAKQLGKIQGVDALVIGSITVLGDKLRIIARLIDTETGGVFSAAATTIPKTQTLISLMKKPAECTFHKSSDDSSHSSSVSTSNTQYSSSHEGGAGNAGKALFENNLFSVGVTSTHYSIASRATNDILVVGIQIYNKTDQALKICIKNISAAGSDGGIFYLSDYRGGFYHDTYIRGLCFEGVSENYTYIPKGTYATAVLGFQRKNDRHWEDKKKGISTFSFSAIVKAGTGDDTDAYNAYSVGMNHIPIEGMPTDGE